MQGQQQQILPREALCKINCCSSTTNWMVYYGSKEGVVILKLNQHGKYTFSNIIQFKEEPITFIKCYEYQSKLFLLIGFVFKVLLYRVTETQQVQTNMVKLLLNCNVVQFKNGFIAADIGEKNGIKSHFLAVTRGGIIYTIPFNSTTIDQVDKIQSGCQQITAICFIDRKIVLGDEKGRIIIYNVINKAIETYKSTNSNLPILNIKKIKDDIILTTCTGQVHIINSEKSSYKVISAHQSVILRMQVINDADVYTFGEDRLLHHFKYHDGDLSIVKTEYLKMLPGLFFSFKGKLYFTLYQHPFLKKFND